MRLLIVGTLKGQLTTATKLAMEKGAPVTHADRVEQALAVLRSGRGADLIMADVAIDIRDLVLRLEAEHIHVPIVACGTGNDARAAVAAIHAGAKEYIDLVADQNELPRSTQKKLEFFTERFIDAVSPTNFAATNPAVLRKTFETGGTNLIKGGTVEPEKLVNMSNQNYRLEPNPIFTPDMKYIVFRSNMYGADYAFAVEVAATRQSAAN